MSIRLWFFFAAFALALNVHAAEVSSGIFKRGAALLEAGKSAESIPLFQEVLKSVPDDDAAIWNLGLAAADAGDYKLALATWLHYRKLFPDDPQGMAKVIQAYQGLNQLVDRDREREALFAFRRTLPAEEIAKNDKYCRDQFRVQDKKVLVFEYFEPKGEWRIFYRFSVLDAARNEQLFYSLGSYEATTRILREAHKIAADARIYHLDKYEDRANVHSTYGFFDTKPDYDVVRQRVVDALSGKSGPMSSSRKSADSNGAKAEAAESKP